MGPHSSFRPALFDTPELVLIYSLIDHVDLTLFHIQCKIIPHSLYLYTPL